MDKNEFTLPKMKYLHEATREELIEALKGRCPTFIFSSVGFTGDDLELHQSFWYGGKYTCLGLTDALANEIRRAASEDAGDGRED